MKKNLKVMISLMFLLVLTLSSLSPIKAKAANSSLTYVNITDNSRDFAYKPDPLDLSLTNNQAVLLDAYTFTNWEIPAGKDFHFYVNLQYLTNFEIIIIDSYTSTLTTYNESNSSSFYIHIPAISAANSYYIALNATSPNAHLIGWGGVWQ